MTNTPKFTRRLRFDGGYIAESTDRNPETGAVTMRMYWNGDYEFTPDVVLFQAALDQITNNPETWNQGEWLSALAPDTDRSLSAAPECGTAGCLAGTVALLSGARPAGLATWQSWEEIIPPVSDHAEFGEEETSVDFYAGEKLGIGVVDELNLFGPMNTLFDLWWRSQLLCGGALEIPSDEVIEAAQMVSWHLYSEEMLGKIPATTLEYLSAQGTS
jgi:hypothetical protein